MNQKIYNKIYKDKEFIRVSKYGRTNGICQQLKIHFNIIFDKNFQNEIIYIKSQNKQSLPPLNDDGERYITSKPKINIISTTGVVYDFEECYFIFKQI